jgi:hypothetical protein
MLYTVVMDYRGGTYIAQVDASSVMGALNVWSEGLDTAAITGLSPEQKAELIDDIKESSSRGREPVLIDGLVNAWCASALTSGGMALINIVATKSQQSRLSRSNRKGK